MLEEEVRRARREERDVEDVTVEGECLAGADLSLSLIHISEPTRH